MLFKKLLFEREREREGEAERVPISWRGSRMRVHLLSSCVSIVRKLECRAGQGLEPGIPGGDWHSKQCLSQGPGERFHWLCLPFKEF